VSRSRSFPVVPGTTRNRRSPGRSRSPPPYGAGNDRGNGFLKIENSRIKIDTGTTEKPIKSGEKAMFKQSKTYSLVAVAVSGTLTAGAIGLFAARSAEEPAPATARVILAPAPAAPTAGLGVAERR
jgi:hypothetical protein